MRELRSNLWASIRYEQHLTRTTVPEEASSQTGESAETKYVLLQASRMTSADLYAFGRCLQHAVAVARIQLLRLLPKTMPRILGALGSIFEAQLDNSSHQPT
jgi:hypothetical protein